MRSTIAQKTTQIGILGAGAGGVGSALAIAKKLKSEGIPFEIHLIDKESEILRGSSDKTPGRAGLGYHYKDPKTGKLYMDATIEFEQEYPRCLRGSDKLQDHFMRQGYYVVMKESKDLPEDKKQFGSLFPVEETLKTYDELKEHYTKKCKENPLLKEVFGEPESFHITHKGEDMKQFSNTINLGNVAAVVHTRETLLDWPATRERLCKEVKGIDEIKIHTNTKINTVSRNGEGYSIKTTENGQEKSLKFDYVVNSLWENLEEMDSQMGFETRERTNRLKTIVTVDLPHELKEQSSVFFCMGAHCMFSNMGDGTGMITYAPITNMKHTTEINLDEEFKYYLYGKATKEEKDSLAKKIINGVSQYLPKMKDAKLIKIGFGNIKTYGGFDLMDPRSPFHDREELGVEERELGWISNSCMKLLFFKKNGDQTATLLLEQIKKRIANMQKESTQEKSSYPQNVPHFFKEKGINTKEKNTIVNPEESERNSLFYQSNTQEVNTEEVLPTVGCFG